jgi:hypothetical protein
MTKNMLPAATESAVLSKGLARRLRPGFWVLLPCGDGKLDHWELVTAATQDDGGRHTKVVWDTLDGSGRRRVWRVDPGWMTLYSPVRPIHPAAPARRPGPC